MSSDSYARAAAVRQAAAATRYAQLCREYAAARARLYAADKVRREGDLRVASRMYVSLAKLRGQVAISVQAKQRLAVLAAESQQKLSEIDSRLSERSSDASQWYVPDVTPTAQEPPRPWEDLVAAAFREYDQLVTDYSRVPAVKRELSAHVRKQRRRSEFAAVLDEPKAKALLEMAQRHESEDQPCCAYWAYKEAARLTSAPSGQLARDRLMEMERDPQVVASAEACRELQECHKLYERAERLIKGRPTRARDLFTEITERTPRDSKIWLAAQQRIQEMSQ
jgi:hypothetical protein